MEGYEDFFILFGNVEVERLDDAGFDGYVYRTLCESKRKGVRGLKFWKNLSLGILDQTGSYIPLNDRRLSPVWQYAAQLGMPVLLHVGDPEAFFSPVTPQNERYEELQAHPEWSFCREGLYSFEELMEQQEQKVADNPETDDAGLYERRITGEDCGNRLYLVLESQPSGAVEQRR